MLKGSASVHTLSNTKASRRISHYLHRHGVTSSIVNKVRCSDLFPSNHHPEVLHVHFITNQVRGYESSRVLTTAQLELTPKRVKSFVTFN